LGGSLHKGYHAVLVDEKYPQETVHELGHYFGLWQKEEEYERYPPNGRKLVN